MLPFVPPARARISRTLSRFRSKCFCRIEVKNAERNGAHQLVEACKAELRARGTAVLDSAQARAAFALSKAMDGKSLEEVIELAFRDVPLDEYYERPLVLALANNPGAKAETIQETYGRKNASLVLGHLVYNRFGFFRPFLHDYADQSSVLVEKGKLQGRVTWCVREETLKVFRKLGYIE